MANRRSNQNPRQNPPVAGGRRRNRNRRQGGGVSRTIPQVVNENLIEEVCAVTDPFCEKAKGARWLEDGNTFTLPYQARVVVSVVTNAAGTGAIYFFPTPNKNGFFYRLDSVSPFTVSAPNAGDPSFIANLGDFGELRIVSAGCEWYNISAGTAVGGSVTAVEFPYYGNAAGQVLIHGQVNATANTWQLNRLRDGAWVSRVTSPDGYQFSASTNVSDAENNRRSGLVLMVSGLASSNVIEVVMTVNYEIKLDANVVFARMSKAVPTSASQRIANKAAYYVETTLTPFFEGTRDKVREKFRGAARDALKRLAAGAATAVGSLLGGPSGGMIANAAAGTLLEVD